MSFIAFLIVGLIAGFLARAIMPGNRNMGLFGTTLLGVTGSFVGGMIGSLLRSDGNWVAFQASGLIWSTVGAILVLAATGFASSRRI